MSTSLFVNAIILVIAGAIVVSVIILTRKLVRLRRLHQAELTLLRLMISDAPFGDKLSAICVLIEAQIDRAYASIMMVNPQTATLSCVTSPSLPADFAQQLNGLPVAEGVGACGTAAARNEAVIVKDMLTHEYFQSAQDMIRSYQLRACWSHPFSNQKGDVAGTFAVYFSQPRLPKRYELKLIQQARDWVALVLQQQHEQERREASEAQMLILQRGIEASVNGIVIADARQPGNPLVYINRLFAF
ncbi:MAG: GAF domain-containing protein [Aliidiomarina sp.]|uniref:GAF domain-containing protein n=1 Tax=Aliidiomarina sp. TaxID=1872439 RepID=UPI0025B83A02|nr:GAF domain-containing protein [Aliidiomarina sp.]MCH8501976.1 GAF domain-containing protein [Aliidiomarina sp.]